MSSFSLSSFRSSNENSTHNNSRFDIGTEALSEFQKPLEGAKVVWILGKAHSMEIDWREDFDSIMWCSYRRNFPQMTPYPITSDSGWGCMLRASQMIMAQGVKNHTLGRNWKPGSLIYNRKSEAYCSLVRLFVDQPGDKYLFSIHNMCSLGLAKHDKLPGEWYGPSAAAYVLKGLSEVGRSYQKSGLGTIIASSGVLYVDEVEAMGASQGEKEGKESGFGLKTKQPISSANSKKDAKKDASRDDDGSINSNDRSDVISAAELDPLSKSENQLFDPLLNDPFSPPCSSSSSTPPPSSLPSSKKSKQPNSQSRQGSVFGEESPSDEWKTCVIALIPLRLGLQSLNEQFYPALLRMLELPQSLGFIGGWPNHAVYFVGHSGNTLLGLDPHTTQPTPPLTRTENMTGSTQNDYPINDDAYMNSLKCPDIQYVNIAKIDPSLAIGFVFKTRQLFLEWIDLMEQFTKEFGIENMPFTIEESMPVMLNDTDDDDDDEEDDNFDEFDEKETSPSSANGVMKHEKGISQDDPEDDFVLL